MGRLNIRYIVYRYGHHSPHSGYSRLAEYGKEYFNADVIKVAKPLPKTIIRERFLRRLSKGTPGYDRAAMAAELNAIRHILKDRNYIYHFLYGETTYRYSGKFNNYRQNRIVATFHQPPEGIQKAVEINWHIKQLSAIICVGSSQQEYFADKFDPAKIFVVPLGIDTQFYTPPLDYDLRDPNLCLIVGENYRDFSTLRGVIELILFRRPSTKFMVITSPNSSKLLGQHSNIYCKSSVPESELIDYYRTASIMVSPMLDTTANNAILESLACGLPIVATDVGSIRDYLTPDCAVLVPLNDARKMADSVLGLLEEPAERKKMSEKSREQSCKFSWPNVLNKLRSVYISLQ